MRHALAMAVIAGALAGCTAPPGGFDSPVPAERLNAITKAARERDIAAVPKIIPFLNSDDPAVRLAAIRTLELLTGQTLDYDHAATEWKRKDMVQAWVEWYNRGGTRGEGEEDRVGGR